tara:strand:- start:379 stop:651 length:273 start_codon:yes stop_codon:yes gene_type:complete
MKTLQDYQILKAELENIKSNHKESYLDSCWICVKGSGLNWREYKKLGMKRDSYHGWIFYSTSTNSNGYELYEKLNEVCKGFNLFVSERQL